METCSERSNGSSWVGVKEHSKWVIPSSLFVQYSCFLISCKWRHALKDAVKALESCGFRAKFGLRVLQQKSLLTIDGNERVGMHDHIEEMGWNIVRRSHPNMPHKHNRLWKNEEIEHILANDLGTQETRCLRLNTSRVVDPYIIIKGLGKMKELRFLHVEVSESCRTPELNTCIPCFSDALGYMCVKYYPFRSLPKTFQTKNLVSLEMPNSKIEQIWVEGEHKVLDKLRFLDLSRSKLRTLDLRLAPNLETLDLRGCRDLVELPDGMWMLKHLRSLKLFMCKLLKELPKDLGHLECLEDLDFSDTEINHLPDSICMLKHLKSLNLSGCKLLEKLPEDLGRLECLKMLWLKGTSISHIPQSILLLKGLRILGSRELLQSAGFTSQIKYRLGEYYVKV